MVKYTHIYREKILSFLNGAQGQAPARKEENRACVFIDFRKRNCPSLIRILILDFNYYSNGVVFICNCTFPFYDLRNHHSGK